MDSTDVGMGKRYYSLGHVNKPFSGSFVTHKLRRLELDCNVALEQCILNFIDYALATSPILYLPASLVSGGSSSISLRMVLAC